MESVVRKTCFNLWAKKITFYCYMMILFVCGVLAPGFQPVAAAGKTLSSQSSEIFDISKSATVRDWRYFWKNTPEWRSRLWHYFAQRERKLADWHWTWRVGWLRACRSQVAGWCRQVIEQGLFDRAAVARANAAISVRALGAASDLGPSLVPLLSRAYRQAGNSRNGKILFPGFRILEALVRVGGGEGLARARHLAADHPRAQQYVRMLAGESRSGS